MPLWDAAAASDTSRSISTSLRKRDSHSLHPDDDRAPPPPLLWADKSKDKFQLVLWFSMVTLLVGYNLTLPRIWYVGAVATHHLPELSEICRQEFITNQKDHITVYSRFH